MKHNGKEIKIFYMPFPGCGSIGGALFDNGENYLIFINNLRTPLLQRQAIGHELAHLFLGHELQPISEYLNNGKELRDMEKEANRQAWHYYRQYRDNRL